MFDEHTWKTITGLVAERLRLSVGELDELRGKTTPKLIAAIPYLAGCRDADRVAAQHVTTYLLAESAAVIFDHRRDDDRDVLARLERISHFPDGDKKVIRRGMNLLALIMVNGYEQSVQTDRAQSVYNPIVEGTWDADKIRTALVREVRGAPNPEMDTIIDLERAVRGTWNE